MDITRHNHGGNAESVAAHKRVNSSIRYMQAQVLNEFVCKLHRNEYHLTSKFIAHWLDKPLNAISGRLTELKRDGLIEPTGERRDGCAVLRITEKGKAYLERSGE